MKKLQFDPSHVLDEPEPNQSFRIPAEARPCFLRPIIKRKNILSLDMESSGESSAKVLLSPTPHNVDLDRAPFGR